MKELCERYFKGVEDTRCQCDIDYKLADVLIVVMCAILCGLEELGEIVAYGKEKIDFFNENFGITSIPSESTLSRILNMVNGDVMAGRVVSIMRELIGLSGDVIAIDGKTICSTAKKDSVKKD